MFPKIAEIPIEYYYPAFAFLMLILTILLSHWNAFYRFLVALV